MGLKIIVGIVSVTFVQQEGHILSFIDSISCDYYLFNIVVGIKVSILSKQILNLDLI